MKQLLQRIALVLVAILIILISMAIKMYNEEEYAILSCVVAIAGLVLIFYPENTKMRCSDGVGTMDRLLSGKCRM